MKTKWMIIPVIAMAFGCTREIDTNVTYIDGEFTLYATSGDNETRTILQEDGRVFWKPEDCITVFYGNVPGKFTSTNTEPAASAEFTGSLGSFVLDGETEFKAIYPYSDIIVTPTDEGILSLYLPSEQTAVEGTFADDLFICVAKSKDFNLHFYNVCGGVSFSLARDDIKKVVFRGNNKETLAGTMFVDFADDGIPQVIDFTAGRSSVTLSAPEGETLKKGVWYYLVTAPQTLSLGYTMELWTDEIVETVSSESAVTIRRSAWGVLKDIGSTTTTIEVPEAIDLGLPSGLKWASFNLGASEPEGFGDYYAWGEIEPYYISLDPLVWKEGKEAGYDWKSYRWCDGTSDTPNKYGVDLYSGGFFDGNCILDPEDDAAFMTLGSYWRMPTFEDVSELIRFCTREKTQINGVTGYLMTGPNGNTVFFPAAGDWVGTSLNNAGGWSRRGFYWTSSTSSKDRGTSLDFGDSDLIWTYSRCDGFPIRPVYDNSITMTPDAVDLGLSVKWASTNLGAVNPESYGDYYAWGETDIKDWFAWPTYQWSEGEDHLLTKYCTVPTFGFNGFTDGKTVLELEDDAAHSRLGAKWRMPTKSEVDELLKQCKWTSTTVNGINGFEIKSLINGNSIFLPTAGRKEGASVLGADSYCYYWSSTTYEGYYYGYTLFGNHSDDAIGLPELYRAFGTPIRPVYGDPSIPVESVSLNISKLDICVGESRRIYASVLPSSANIQSIKWSSSDDSIATVTTDGIITGIAPGYATITVETVDGGKTASCSLSVINPRPHYAIPEIVDLGLSVRWASFNLGATKPEEAGDYYAWGETEPYYGCLDPLVWRTEKTSGYNWASYKWCIDSYYSLTKYCYDTSYGYEGFTDGKTVLDPEDDAVHVNLGDKWRMPTKSELNELMGRCNWVWTSLNEVNGFMVTGPNGKTIFLPAAGQRENTKINNHGLYCLLWSSSLGITYPSSAVYLLLYQNGYNVSEYSRYWGLSIRPVFDSAYIGSNEGITPGGDINM